MSDGLRFDHGECRTDRTSGGRGTGTGAAGVIAGAIISRAEPSRAEPSRAEPSRAEPLPASARRVALSPASGNHTARLTPLAAPVRQALAMLRADRGSAAPA